MNPFIFSVSTTLKSYKTIMHDNETKVKYFIFIFYKNRKRADMV